MTFGKKKMIKKITGSHLGIAVMLTYFIFALQMSGCASYAGSIPVIQGNPDPYSNTVTLCQGHSPRHMDCKEVSRDAMERSLRKLFTQPY